MTPERAEIWAKLVGLLLRSVLEGVMLQYIVGHWTGHFGVYQHVPLLAYIVFSFLAISEKAAPYVTVAFAATWLAFWWLS